MNYSLFLIFNHHVLFFYLFSFKDELYFSVVIAHYSLFCKLHLYLYNNSFFAISTFRTALSIVIGFIVSISCCLLLYCCCCQKRSGVHSGKLVWIKRKKQGSKTGRLVVKSKTINIPNCEKNPKRKYLINLE